MTFEGKKESMIDETKKGYILQLKDFFLSPTPLSLFHPHKI